MSVRMSVAKASGTDPNRSAARESADISVGDNVDFFIVVSNEGASPLTNLKVACDLDPSLRPMATNQPESSYRFEGDNTMVFTLASLASGEKKEYVIRCQGANPLPQACVRATATASGADPAKQQACVQIRSAAAASSASLSVDVTTLHDPVAAGKSLTYVVLVTNRGRTDDSQVVVKVAVPPEMIPSLLETYPRANVKGQTVEFPPADRIAAGDTLTYRVRVQAKTPGEVRVQAQVTSANQKQPVTAERKTTIIAGQ